jgi:hypothetical protein
VESGIVPGPVFLAFDGPEQEFEALHARGVTFAEPEPVDATPVAVRPNVRAPQRSAYVVDS